MRLPAGWKIEPQDAVTTRYTDAALTSGSGIVTGASARWLLRIPAEWRQPAHDESVKRCGCDLLDATPDCPELRRVVTEVEDALRSSDD